jgi:hypothetical protein
VVGRFHSNILTIQDKKHCDNLGVVWLLLGGKGPLLPASRKSLLACAWLESDEVTEEVHRLGCLKPGCGSPIIMPS